MVSSAPVEAVIDGLPASGTALGLDQTHRLGWFACIQMRVRLIGFWPLDWSLALRRFLDLGRETCFGANQKLIQLVIHAAGAAPFDSRRYVLQLDDQFAYANYHAGPGIVLRHYVAPARHKLSNTS